MKICSFCWLRPSPSRFVRGQADGVVTCDKQIEFTISLQCTQTRTASLHAPLLHRCRCMMQVRVFCRVRPSPSSIVTCQQDGVGVRVDGGEASTQGAFSFDKVFGPGSSQVDVFSEVAELVQSALDGYQACLIHLCPPPPPPAWVPQNCATMGNVAAHEESRFQAAELVCARCSRRVARISLFCTALNSMAISKVTVLGSNMRLIGVPMDKTAPLLFSVYTTLQQSSSNSWVHLCLLA